MTRKNIRETVKRLGICLDETSSGDGATRYSFHKPGPKPYTLGRTLAYCVGAREAEVFLRGYEEGKAAANV